MNEESVELRGVNILSGNAISKNVNVFIENGRISYIGRSKRSATNVIDLGKEHVTAIPGLVNTHTHIAMAPLRGSVDAVKLESFLEITGEYDRSNTSSNIYDSTVLGIAEMIKNGITDFVDFYYGEDVVAKAVESMHYQGNLAWTVLDEDKTTQKGNPLSNAERFIKSNRNDRVSPMTAVQGVYAASKETISSAYDIAEKYSTNITMHIAETEFEVQEHKKAHGKTPVEWMYSNGLIRKNLLAVHCVWLSKKEISIIAKKAGAVSYNPTSNMKLGSGIAPISDLAKAGSNITLGTDSVASNNSLDIISEMKCGSILQSAKYLNPEAISPEQAFSFATHNASSFLHGEHAALTPGSRADITLLRLQTMPKENPINRIVYATNPSDVFATMVAGEMLYMRGKFQEKLEKEIAKAQRSISIGKN